LQVAIRADGAGAKENESKRAKKFGGELLKGCVHGGEILAEETAGREKELTQSAQRAEHRALRRR
jgi:hypothetical protein